MLGRRSLQHSPRYPVIVRCRRVCTASVQRSSSDNKKEGAMNIKMAVRMRSIVLMLGGLFLAGSGVIDLSGVAVRRAGGVHQRRGPVQQHWAGVGAVPADGIRPCPPAPPSRRAIPLPASCRPSIGRRRRMPSFLRSRGTWTFSMAPWATPLRPSASRSGVSVVP
jgi:hypothetical protein